MSLTEQKLIQQIKQGDHQAMESLFRQHVDAAVRLAYLITRNWATAEDAVQEAFIQAFRSINTFQDGRPFKPWFTRIVVNKAKRVGHKLNQKHELLETTDLSENYSPVSPEEQALDNESQRLIFTSINMLGEKHRLPIILKYLNGLTEAETAQVLQVPVSTIKSRLFVARNRLRDYLNKQEGSEKHDG